MARIQSLTTITSVSNTDVLAIEHNTGTGTYKVPISMLLSDVYSKSEAVAKADIVDNLTSTATEKPLSANMGKALNDNIINNSVTGASAITTTHNLTYARVARLGHLVIATITIIITSDIPAWTTIFTINNVALAQSTYVFGDVSNSICEFYVGTGGNVSCTTAISSGKEIKMTIPIAVN